MKKTVKRILAALLCAAALPALAACGGQPEPETAPPGAAKNAGNGKSVYFAGPMFDAGEKDFNLKVVEVLEEYGYDVFLPQRDGIEGALLEGKTEEELVGMIFELDVQRVMAADIIVMNVDGRVPDEGACVELGIGYAAGKRCYAVKTDTRSLEKSMSLNPLIAGPMIEIFEDYDGDSMIGKLRAYLDEHDL